MNRKIIGIPRSFLYHKYYILWDNFFHNLGYKIEVSEPTNKQTIKLGEKYLSKDADLLSKIYLGHIVSLKEKCDYILVSQINKKSQLTNNSFNSKHIYNIINKILNNKQVLQYNIKSDNSFNQFITLFKLGFKLTKNPYLIIKNYIFAKHQEVKNNKRNQLIQSQILFNSNPKILIASDSFIIHDNYLGQPIEKKLHSLGIDVIYPDFLSKSLSKLYANQISSTVKSPYSKEITGAINYYQYTIKGIVFINEKNPPMNQTNFLKKLNDIPTLNLNSKDLTIEKQLENKLIKFSNTILKE